MTNRILTIGDIHGCARALDTILGVIDLQEADLLITLGDYVDRGLDSSGVLDRLIRLHAAGNLVALRGNHEEMMMESRNSREHLSLWVHCGGDSTLCCYSSAGYSQALARVPDAHWEFLERVCVDRYETETHFFVHAGVKPHIPLAEQSLTDLRWMRFDNPLPHVSGKIMVCGHTPQESGQPRDLGHAVCIDTGAYDGGWLTCLDVIHGKIWQANERGQLRRG